jgi:hypothetical protein
MEGSQTPQAERHRHAKRDPRRRKQRDGDGHTGGEG